MESWEWIIALSIAVAIGIAGTCVQKGWYFHPEGPDWARVTLSDLQLRRLRWRTLLGVTLFMLLAVLTFPPVLANVNSIAVRAVAIVSGVTASIYMTQWRVSDYQSSLSKWIGKGEQPESFAYMPFGPRLATICAASSLLVLSVFAVMLVETTPEQRTATQGFDSTLSEWQAALRNGNGITISAEDAATIPGVGAVELSIGADGDFHSQDLGVNCPAEGFCQSPTKDTYRDAAWSTAQYQMGLDGIGHIIPAGSTQLVNYLPSDVSFSSLTYSRVSEEELTVSNAGEPLVTLTREGDGSVSLTYLGTSDNPDFPRGTYTWSTE